MYVWKWLEDELEAQEKAIIQKEGVVNKEFEHVNPYEITKAIATIPHQDMTEATATEADVKQGKTFFAGTSELKTGTAQIDMDATNSLFMPPYETVTYDGEIFYSIPSDVTIVRKYCFYSNFNNVKIVFHENIEKIEDYAFFKTSNFSFDNWEDLKKLKSIGIYGFSLSGLNNAQIGRFPDTMQSIGENAFYDATFENQDFVFPASMTVLGQSAFMKTARAQQNSLDISKLTIKTLQGYLFYYSAFYSDFIPSSSVTTIGVYFNYNGCFRNIIIPSTIKTVGSYSFGAAANRPLSDFYTQYCVFENETPPTCNKSPFATQNINNGMKIYVPDNSLEAYKAVTNLLPYVDAILPMSQKP